MSPAQPGRHRAAARAASRTEIAGDIPPLAPSWVLSERVYRAMLQMLAQGSLQRGATLHIAELSKALGVSPTPVREALARLAVTGLVVHEARKGYRIAPPLGANEIRQLMQARQLLEVGAIGHACRLGGDTFRTEIAAAYIAQAAEVDRLQSAGPASRTERAALEWRVLEADLHFHQVIFKHTHNRFIGVMADALKAQLHRIRQTAEQGLVDHRQALAEHKTILDAIMRNDAEAAEEMMRRHMSLVEKRSAAELAFLEARVGAEQAAQTSEQRPGEV